MLIKKEQIIWSEWNSGEVYLFPGIKINKKFPWEWGRNFYRELDRYGNNNLFVLFPIQARLKNNQIIPNEKYSTLLIWSVGLTFVDTLECSIYSIPDDENKLGYTFYLLSAKKGTRVRMRDELEEMELVF
jgi:hypothetical protein